MARPTNQHQHQREALHQEGLRTCGSCSLTKPEADYGRSAKDPYGLQRNCKPCTNKRNREQYAPNMSAEVKARKVVAARERMRALPPEKKQQYREAAWRRNLSKNYGMLPEDFHAMLIEQSGRCELCGRPLADLHVDHDHATGEVRGLLHPQCNVGLGSFEDSPARLRQAADYLERHLD